MLRSLCRFRGVNIDERFDDFDIGKRGDPHDMLRIHKKPVEINITELMLSVSARFTIPFGLPVSISKTISNPYLSSILNLQTM
uniref:Uncharacterized protein n=1 Tax=Bracon brevicornis TaxID=1563983 RepID=A0A6V7JEN0_9HYME